MFFLMLFPKNVWDFSPRILGADHLGEPAGGRFTPNGP
jgi:hypothetical protein